MRSSRNNVLAGLLVVASLALAIFVVVILGGLREALGKHPFQIRFDLIEGTSGLESGSKVLLGGRPIGTVGTMRFDPPNGQPQSVIVTINVERTIEFRKDAVGYLLSPLLGGSGTINFMTVGAGAALAAGEYLEGSIAPPTLLASAGYGDEQKEQVQNIIKRVSEASTKIDEFMDDLKPVSADVREKWPVWSGRVDSITANVDATVAKGPQIADDLQSRLDQVKELLTTAQGYLDENRDNIKDGIARFRNIGEKAETFMDRLNGQLSEQAVAFLEKAQDAFESAKNAVENIDLLRQEQLPNIRRTFANFRLASDQLSATLAEVRRSPWRLLYRPDTRELEFELLYDSARAYASAVSDLRNAAESIESLNAASGSGPAPEPGRVDVMIQDLENAFTKYQDAEAEFLRLFTVRAEKK